MNHSADEYVRGDARTNTIEGFFSILKRGIYGTALNLAATATLPGAPIRASLSFLFSARMTNRSLRLWRRVERAAQSIVHTPLGFLVAVSIFGLHS